MIGVTTSYSINVMAIATRRRIRFHCTVCSRECENEVLVAYYTFINLSFYVSLCISIEFSFSVVISIILSIWTNVT